ncbi:unnamed protein product [Closterium sp. Naga37s-1]|nr:unnamed protein product [Closterium sp. Naga37s-1]
MNLDGETNLKLRQALHETYALDGSQLARLRGTVECEHPNVSIYTFTGKMRLEGLQETPIFLSPTNILLRGSKLRNTRFAVGLVVYSGRETKIMMNATDPPSKRSFVERRLDYVIIFELVLMLTLAIFPAAVFAARLSYQEQYMWYLELDQNAQLTGLNKAQYNADNPALAGVLQFFTCLVLYGMAIGVPSCTLPLIRSLSSPPSRPLPLIPSLSSSPSHPPFVPFPLIPSLSSLPSHPFPLIPSLSFLPSHSLHPLPSSHQPPSRSVLSHSLPSLALPTHILSPLTPLPLHIPSPPIPSPLIPSPVIPSHIIPSALTPSPLTPSPLTTSPVFPSPLILSPRCVPVCPLPMPRIPISCRLLGAHIAVHNTAHAHVLASTVPSLLFGTLTMGCHRVAPTSLRPHRLFVPIVLHVALEAVQLLHAATAPLLTTRCLCSSYPSPLYPPVPHPVPPTLRPAGYFVPIALHVALEILWLLCAHIAVRDVTMEVVKLLQAATTPLCMPSSPPCAPPTSPPLQATSCPSRCTRRWRCSCASLFRLLSAMLLGYFVPISLYVTMEIVKLLQAVTISMDLHMYYEDKDIPALARTSNINEELGMVRTVLSDKTGTLTRNQMEFFKCSIAGTPYGMGVTEVEKAAAQRAGRPPPQEDEDDDQVYLPERPLEKGFNMRDPRLDGMKWVEQPCADEIRRFLEVLSVCHTVVVDTAPIERTASSNIFAMGTAAGVGGEGGMGNGAGGVGEGASPGMKSSSSSVSLASGGSSVRGGGAGSAGAGVMGGGGTPLLPGEGESGGETPSPLVPGGEEAVDGEAVRFLAESPDEAAFVVAAKRLGFLFLGRQGNELKVREYGARWSVVQDRSYELLNTLEFTSHRKRMSVVVRTPEGRLLLLCKGADSVIMDRLGASEQAQKYRPITERHMTMYAEAGLRTLAIAWREVGEEEYAVWQQRWVEAKGYVADAGVQAERLEALADELESELVLVGATAIEDKLQVGVPQAIEALAVAGINLWVLTGDKLETAINIGFACSLLRHHMQQHLVFLEDNDAAVKEAARRGVPLKEDHSLSSAHSPPHFPTPSLPNTCLHPPLAPCLRALQFAAELVRSQILAASESVHGAQWAGAQGGGAQEGGAQREGSAEASGRTSNRADNHAQEHSGDGGGSEGGSEGVGGSGSESGSEGGAAQEHAVVIDGKALALVLADDALRAAFLELALQCASVICCRVSPKQKAQVTAMVRREGKQICLAIGDGANDVGMIQKANIGVGIRGEEGQQAVMASDFAIGQFRFLERLLLVHGGWCYKRICILITYFFYKCFVFAFTILFYNCLAYFSGTAVYYDWYLTLFMVFFTSLPIAVVGVMDQDVKAVYRLRYPQLYKQGQRNEYFSVVSVASWMVNGLVQAGILFTLTLLPFALVPDRPTGLILDLTAVGTIMYASVVTTVNLELGSNVQYWNALHFITIFGSILFFFILMTIGSYLPANWVGNLVGVAGQLLPAASFWLNLLLAVVAAMLPSYTIRGIWRHVCPGDHEVVQEIERRERRRRLTRLSTMARHMCTGAPLVTNHGATGAADVERSAHGTAGSDDSGEGKGKGKKKGVGGVGNGVVGEYQVAAEQGPSVAEELRHRHSSSRDTQQ